MNGSGATDGERPVQVHGRWTVAATSPTWSLAATLSASPQGDWLLPGDNVTMLLGWTPAELQAITGSDLLHPDDRDRLEGIVTNAANRPGHFVPVEVRILARDSRYWRSRWHLTFALGGPCELHGIDFVGPDPGRGPLVATWRWHVETDVVSWSPELLDLFDLNVGPPASVGSFLATVHEDDRHHVARHLRLAVLHDDSFQYTFRCPTSEGRDLWFHAVGRCCVDADGAREVAGLVKYLNPPSTPATAERIIGCG